jgi:hypothetical protein
MISNVIILLILLLISSQTVYSYNINLLQKQQINRPRSIVVFNSVNEVNLEDEGLKEFLLGPEKKKWKGVKDMLVRKGQIPDEKYTPKDVVKIILTALQDNDSPQLDHGACVALEFRSATGPLNDPNLDPAGYGQFLRSTEYSSLIDFKSVKFIGEPIELADSLSVKQSVEVVGWQSKGQQDKIFDFYLSRSDNKWLIDVILLRK